MQLKTPASIKFSKKYVYPFLIAIVQSFLCSSQARAQDGVDLIEIAIASLKKHSENAQYYSADLLFENAQIELKGRVEFLKGSQIFVGEFRNKPNASVQGSSWAPIEFGLFGTDSQIYYPSKRKCEIYIDEPNQLPGPFPLNPLLLFSEKRLGGLIQLLRMPGQSSSETLQEPKETLLSLSYPRLIALGEQAGIHYLKIAFNENVKPSRVELLGGGLGNFKTLIKWEKSSSDFWYPHEQKLYEVAPGESVEISKKPSTYCKVSSLTTHPKDFLYLPKSVEERLPFGTMIVRYPSAFGKTADQSTTRQYVGGKDGELQYRLDSIAEEMNVLLETKH
jgi:hypothetical protein